MRGISGIIKSDVPNDTDHLLSIKRNVHYCRRDDECFAVIVKVRIA